MYTWTRCSKQLKGAANETKKNKEKTTIMALDMEKMKKKYENSQKKSSGFSESFLKVDEKNPPIKARALPPEDGDAFKEYWLHYGPYKSGVIPFLCPKRNFGEPCPMCDFVRVLYKQDTEASKKMAGRLTAKPRYYTPVLNRETGEVKIFAYNTDVYQEFLRKVTNPDYGDITDQNTGTDFEVKKVPDGTKKVNGEQLYKFVLEFSRRPSALASSAEEVDDICKRTPDLEALLYHATPAEIQQTIEKISAGDNPEAVAKEETTKYGDGGAVTVEKAFEQLS